MISEREKFLMREAMAAAIYYKDIDQWLGEVINDNGDTVEQYLDYFSTKLTKKIKGHHQ